MSTVKTKLVTFSGIDGAGKSTQIQALQDSIRDTGAKATLLTFWDDVVALRGLREFLSDKAFKGDKGVGSPEKPISRRDKNVTARYTTAVRLFFYLMDTISLQRTVRLKMREGHDFIVLDRYIYDELANLPLDSAVVRLYLRFVLSLSPRPDAAFIVDADPDAAYRRKPEYPLEFIRRNREAYLRLSRIVGGMTIVGPGSVEEMTAQVLEAIAAKDIFTPDNSLQLSSAMRPSSTS